jgi:hypothetical protein
MEELRIAILPFVIASSQKWNDRCVTFTLDTPISEQQAVTIEMDLLRRRVLFALRGYLKEHGNGTEMCPELWINGHGRVMEVVRKNATSRAVEQGGAVFPAHATRKSSAPPYPTDGQLDSTIRSLAWYKRSWQKLKWRFYTSLRAMAAVYVCSKRVIFCSPVTFSYSAYMRTNIRYRNHTDIETHRPSLAILTDV